MSASDNAVIAMTVKEAALELRCSAAHVRKLLAQGKLRRHDGLRGDLLMIDALSVVELYSQRTLNPPRRGRPRKQVQEAT